ncbi:MAG: Glycosyltransferase UbiE [Verrucomicrobia bacterium]|jgi:SAM-dependent methyltransferase|nr:MAG: Glycosyltransferase UbiE [Verrucomicrobiota bacterium]
MTSSLPASTARYLDGVRDFYDSAPTELRWGARGYRALLAHYYNLIVPADASVLEIGCGSGELLSRLNAARKTGLDLSPRQIEAARRRVPGATFHVQAGELLELDQPFDVIIISDTLNLAADVQLLLERLQRSAHPGTRLVINFQNSLWRPLLTLARWLGLKAPQPENSWLASSDVLNLLQLAGWDPVCCQSRLLLPVPVPLLASLLNRWVAPLLQWFCLTIFIVARPVRPATQPRTVSVIIPARNEAGNIEAAIQRTAELGAGTEIIFVEGHSRDDTWSKIQQVARDHPERKIKLMQQTGRGKGDAVRLGFAAATGDILMILDADLTMPPEELPKFYDVIASGRAEFANGVRLVYPMDEEAMQFLNLCANKTFGLIFTWLLGQPVKDTLCGTKVLSRTHYERIAANRAYFGDFDPFGDFDLLFGAAKLNLKIADVPIRYRERTYGTTNIQRWSHGWLLLRMVMFAARKLKFV